MSIYICASCVRGFPFHCTLSSIYYLQIFFVCLFNNGHSEWCELTPHCGFDLHCDVLFIIGTAAAAAKLLQLCPTLRDPINGSPPGSAVPGFLQARTLEWIAISFPIAWKWKVKSESEVAQSCLTLRDPMNCSLPGSSVHGVFQARALEWGEGDKKI